MTFKITCPFSLPSSHEIHEAGFRGENKIDLETPFTQDNFLGVIGTNIEITSNDKHNYTLIVTSDSLSTKEEQISYLEKVAEYLSLIISKNENSPNYGTNFVQMEWFYLTAIRVQEDSDELHSTVHISDSLSISSTRSISLFANSHSNISYHDLLRFYFDGLRAEHKKSKYFHWFLILEFLEASEKYKILFNNEKLFDEPEAQILRGAADKMNSGVKKCAVLNLLSRTKHFRNFKLLTIINSLGIHSTTILGTTEEISESTIKKITDGRNALFHSGSEFPETILWCSLFPLVRQIVEYVSCNPACLDA